MVMDCVAPLGELPGGKVTSMLPFPLESTVTVPATPGFPAKASQELLIAEPAAP
jgi:hypothetical protein